MRIEVTQKHIEAGRRKSPSCCPVALAMREQTGVRGFVTRGSFLAGLDGTGEGMQRLPREVLRRISEYDTRGYMEPFGFNLWTEDE